MSKIRTAHQIPRVLLGVAACLLAYAAKAQATLISYGNFAGPTVTYQNVSEVPTQLPGPNPPFLFGAPVLSADTLMFPSTNFVVGVTGGDTEFQDGRLTFGAVPSNPAGNITSLLIAEGGAWSVNGGTSATLAKESLIVNELFITSVNGTSINPFAVAPTYTETNTLTGSANVTTSNGSLLFTSDGGAGSGSWNVSANFDIAAALAAHGLTGKVTGITLDLDNQLTADSEAHSTSFIDKKFFNVTGDPVAVPEPATASLGVLTVLGLLSKRRARA